MIDLPNPIGFNQPVRGDAFNKLIEAVRRSRPLPSSSIKVSQSSRGTLLELVQTEQVSSNVSKSSDENMHPYKLHVFREEYTDSTTGEKTYQYYCGCYIPNGSCVVNGNVSQLRNTAKVSSLVDVDRLPDSDKSLLEDYANDWYSLSPTSDGSIYVHVLEEKYYYSPEGEDEFEDRSEYIVTNSPDTPYTAGDTSEGDATIKRIKWTFRVGSFSTSQDGSVSVSSQVLNTALMLSSGNNGKNGGYYIPHVDASGNLTFTPSDTGSMPDITGNWNIKGDTGATGATGPVGPTGASGEGMTGGDWFRLEEAIDAATGAAGQANGAASNANSSAASANSAAQSASNAATTATSAATAASNAAQNATNAAENASAAAERADQSSQLSESQAQQVQAAIALAQAAAEAATNAAADALDAAEEASNAVGPTGPTGDSGGVLLAESVETFAIDKNGDWSTFQPEGN